MKDNWNELFDSMEKEDILRNLPQDLPVMEDELAAKRIENRVMQEMEIDIGFMKKNRRKRFLAAAIGCIAVLGVFGRESILAAFERLFHDLPGVGVYINDEDKKVYEVWIDDPVQEKDGVRVELVDFYCEGKQIYGNVCITGENLMVYDEEMDHQEEENALEEKFPTTWYYGEKEKKFHSSGTGVLMEDGYIKRYNQRGWEWNYLEKGIDTYYLEVGGFDRIFTLKIVEPKTVKTPEEIGYSQTLNNTTITARASAADNEIQVELYIIPSEEVKLAMENRYSLFISNMPYMFDWEEQRYVQNADGEKLRYKKYRNLANGVKLWYEGTEKDFPLTLHQPTLTGSGMENYMVTVPLPEDGGTLTENLPKIEFAYGTVEILSITRKNGEYDNRDAENPKQYPVAVVDLIYRVTPKEGLRQMYAVEMEVEEEIYSWEGLDIGTDPFVSGGRIYLEDMESREMSLKFYMPSYWIKGDYDIVIEKPGESTDRSSAIDEENDAVYTHFNIMHHSMR